MGGYLCVRMLVNIEGKRDYANDYVLCSEALWSAGIVVKRFRLFITTGQTMRNHATPRNSNPFLQLRASPS